MIKDQKICKKCVMDTTSKGIVFNENGCNHCDNYFKIVNERKKNFGARITELKKIIYKIKKSKDRYNCLIGLSGGLDSTFLCYFAYKFGLNPLLVHFDNTWDDEKAVSNINNIIKKTKFDYINYIVDVDEFHEIQKAYFKAGVPDVEIPTDLAIFSLIKKIAIKYKIKNILYGGNYHTESIMGNKWNYEKKTDLNNFFGILNFSNIKNIKTYPILNNFENYLFNHYYKIKTYQIFENLEFNENKIIKKIETVFNWKKYEQKHGESFFTNFIQKYYLPKKFNIDKRKAHLSCKICSGNLSRDNALEILNREPYLNKLTELKDLNFFLNKIGFKKDEFFRIIKSKNRHHEEFNYHVRTDIIINLKIFIYKIINRIKYIINRV